MIEISTNTIVFQETLSDEFAQQLVAMIQQVNQKKEQSTGYSQMIPKTSEQIQKQVSSCGGRFFVDEAKKQLVSALLLSELGEYEGKKLYELGSVITDEAYQKQGYAKRLMQKFLDSVSEDKHIVIVGTSDEVNTMYQKHYSNEFPFVSQDDLKKTQGDLFAIINNPPLGEKDCLYFYQKTIEAFCLKISNK